MTWVDFDFSLSRRGSGIGRKGYDGREKKLSVTYNGRRYMLKTQHKLDMPKRTDLQASYSSSPFSEYVSCHIFKSAGIPVQETLIGRYNSKAAVACEDFMQDYPQTCQLQEFHNFENSFMEDMPAGRTPHLETVEAIFHRHPMLEGIRNEASSRYWDTFIIDALIGNFDRHSGNWGYIVDLDSDDIHLAPVYDCGSSLFPELSDDKIKEVLKDEESMQDRIYKYPSAALIANGKKVAYYDFIANGGNSSCIEALERIYPKIEMDRVHRIVDATPLITDERNALFHRVLSDRYEHILTKAYKQHRHPAKPSGIRLSKHGDSLSAAQYVKAERPAEANPSIDCSQDNEAER